MALKIWQVDSFTSKPFGGNPAGVCILDHPREESWMQSVAAEMNVSETAFLVLNGNTYDLRWFTPTVEVALCGHATLAGAHILWEDGHLWPDQPAKFNTKSGLLTATRKGEWIELDFPATPPAESAAPPGLNEALGLESPPLYVGRSRFDYQVEAANENEVRGLKPDFTALSKIEVRGVMVTARSDSPEFDFVSRFFAPGSGVAEDPATGSSHCCLGPYWRTKLDKDEFTAHQVSARGGIIKVRVAGDRVILGGQAVTVLSAELNA
jgi:PhzF family phenazine biosynthesis protein